MEFQPLARKYRPITFAGLAGQETTAETLRQSVLQHKIKPAYIFSGTRGVGKTSAARIFARAINCLAPEDGEPCNTCEACTSLLHNRASDVLEIDAASYTKVEQTREVLSGVVYKPASLRYKVYIIDEAHMLSKSSFNALLKTLEEPPEHALFILATTEPEKIIETVRSRCQKFYFQSPGNEVLKSTFASVLEREQVAYEDEGLDIIVTEARGSVRDGLSLLDQVASAKGEVTASGVRAALGMIATHTLQQILLGMIERDASAIRTAFQDLESQGARLAPIGERLIETVHHAIRERATGKEYDAMPAFNTLALSDLFRMGELLFAAYEKALRSPMGFVRFELSLLRIATLKPLAEVFADGPQKKKSIPDINSRLPEDPETPAQASPPSPPQDPRAASPASAPEKLEVEKQPPNPMHSAEENHSDGEKDLETSPMASTEQPTSSAAPDASTPSLPQQDAEHPIEFKDRAINDPAVQAFVRDCGASIISIENLNKDSESPDALEPSDPHIH